jgi:hypothetical protein
LDTLDFQSHVARRTAEFQRLYSKGGLRRRITLVEGKVDGPNGNLWINSTPSGINVDVFEETEYKQWGTIRWRPTAVPQSRDEELYTKMARRAIFGIQGAVTGKVDGWGLASDLWNVLPWSWMVDWFSNYGDFFNAHRNTIPVQPSGKINIMTYQKTTQRAKRTYVSGDGFAVGGEYVLVRTTQERWLGEVGLAASVPFISDRKLSVLGALRIQRLRVYP